MRESANSAHGVLVVDDDPQAARALADVLRGAGYDAAQAASTRLERMLAEREFDVVIYAAEGADALLGIAGGAASAATKIVLERGTSDLPPPAVIHLAGFGSIHDAVEAMRAGAFDYLSKPATDEQILVSVARAVEHRALRAENRRLRADLSQRFELSNMISRDASFQRVFQTVEALADTRATLLIVGESGTGKSLLARTIHQRSSRASAPFVEVNCGALPDTLLESELFGHTRGAFTGAIKDKPGKFEAADRGTLFLDEIASAPLELQVKLLRVLQEKTFERLGETRTRSADVRVIAASNADLEAAVRAGTFREDLYYRIHVVVLRLAPLRERAGDIPLLAEHFAQRFATEHARPARRLSPACTPLLSAYRWPGNVRELEHCIERAVLLSRTDEIEPPDLELGARERSQFPHPSAGTGNGLEPASLAPTLWSLDSNLSLRQALELPEREIIRRALERNGGNRQATARMLDVNRTTLFNKMKKYDLMRFPVRSE
jgi:DNA-binding NtrC family response regulator